MSEVGGILKSARRSPRGDKLKVTSVSRDAKDLQFASKLCRNSGLKMKTEEDPGPSLTTKPAKISISFSNESLQG